MRNPSRSLPAQSRVLAGIASALLLFGPGRVRAQSPGDLVKRAHDRQRDFEMFRQSRIPIDRGTRENATCDQRIGRICIWFGGEDEADFPPEAAEVGLARNELIGVLTQASAAASDPWVTGELVHYLAQAGALGRAEQVARACDLGEKNAWWCSALLGYVQHLQGHAVDAEASFRAALASMPKKELEKWGSPHYIISRDDEKAFNKVDPAERERRWALFWRLSDPLFLVEGNDRFTDHFARWVQARNQKDAESPEGMFWEDDVEETLIRYGMVVGYSRVHDPSRMMRGGRVNLQDTRQIIGHHPTHSRGYLFPEQFLKSPSEIPPESWLTAPREARTWYAPAYAPDFRGLESQVGRFRRGDDMLVVGAFQPAAATAALAAQGLGGSDEPIEGPVQSALFLVPEEGGDLSEVHGNEAEGVFSLLAPPGKYVSSLEVFEPGARRAWRARQGVRQVPLVPGLVAVSDLLILEAGATRPETLDEALGHVRRGVRIRQGERFTVVWEVYGLQVKDPAQVTLGFTEGHPEFLTPVSDFQGVLDPDQPVTVRFEDTGDEGVQFAFRAVTLELPDLAPGPYTLHLRLDLPGREAAITSRPIVVEAAGG